MKDSIFHMRSIYLLPEIFNIVLKKIPCILLIFRENIFQTYFHQKTEVFNKFFAKQCYLIVLKFQMIFSFYNNTT